MVSGTYQPPGTDYIIHVLGDKQRENYLDTFDIGSFKYAATIKETYTDWEYWVQRANWFFYRKLYEVWHPVYSNTYEVYWERNADEQNWVTDQIRLSVVDIDETTKKLVVRAGEVVNGIADVYIDYKVENNKKKSSRWVFARNLQIINTGTVYAGQGQYFESNYLRDISKEYIPVPMINGYGEVTISSCPARNTVLQLHEASCGRIFTCTSDCLEIMDIREGETESIIRLANTAKKF